MCTVILIHSVIGTIRTVPSCIIAQECSWLLLPKMYSNIICITYQCTCSIDTDMHRQNSVCLNLVSTHEVACQGTKYSAHSTSHKMLKR